MTKEREISTFQINFLVYNISCVEIISFFSEIYNNPTLFILQYFFAIVKDFSLEIWYNINGDIMREVKPYTLYKHFKGFTVLVLGIAKHTETAEDLVIYYCMSSNNTSNHTDGIYARPLEMFLSEVDHEKYPDVKQKYRFEEVMKK